MRLQQFLVTAQIGLAECHPSVGGQFPRPVSFRVEIKRLNGNNSAPQDLDDSLTLPACFEKAAALRNSHAGVKKSEMSTATPEFRVCLI